MRSPWSVAVFIAAGSLLLSGIVNALLVPAAADPTTAAYAEAIGVAVSAPVWIVMFAYFVSRFDFDAYFGKRSYAGLGGDLALVILAAASVGLVATAVGVWLLGPGLGTRIVGGIGLVSAAFVTFLSRGQPYLNADTAV